jgi:uncharacterized membrane-anchored protein YhcB (DUF1043 family)
MQQKLKAGVLARSLEEEVERQEELIKRLNKDKRNLQEQNKQLVTYSYTPPS